jgi:hypothetical protein
MCLNTYPGKSAVLERGARPLQQLHAASRGPELATYEELTEVGIKHGDLAITFGDAYKDEWALNKPPPPVAPPASPNPSTPSGANPSPAR